MWRLLKNLVFPLIEGVFLIENSVEAKHGEIRDIGTGKYLMLKHEVVCNDYIECKKEDNYTLKQEISFTNYNENDDSCPNELTLIFDQKIIENGKAESKSMSLLAILSKEDKAKLRELLM